MPSNSLLCQRPGLLRHDHLARLTQAARHLGLIAGTCASLASPPNDQLAGAIRIPSFTFQVSGSNVDATREPLEPTHAHLAGGRSVWWTWVCPKTGPVTFDTTGSGLDTLLAVYIGDSMANLTEVAANDDESPETLSSRVTFQAVAGTNYRIAVDGARGDEGAIVLNVPGSELLPRITTPPDDLRLLTGHEGAVTVVASGAEPLSYQWYRNDVTLLDGTNASYSLTGAAESRSGTYRVEVSNMYGMVSSPGAEVTIGPVLITSHPKPLTVAMGYPARFTGSAIGTNDVTYQWYKDTQPIPLATGPSLVIPSATYADAGMYRLVAYTGERRVASAKAQLTVAAPYTFTTFAGIAASRGTNDGRGLQARFAYPHGITIDKADNLYVTELGNYAIRKITPAGDVSTLARLGPVSIGENPFSGGPWSVAVDPTGALYIADTPRHIIIKRLPNGTIQPVAGMPGQRGNADGTETAARFDTPSGVALDAAGNLFVADWGNDRIRMVAPDRVVTTVAGSSRGVLDTRWTKSRFNGPSGLALDAQGNLWIADEYNNRLRRLGADGWVTTVAGSGTFASLDGVGPAAAFTHPHGPALDRGGNLFVVDMDESKVRRITANGSVTTVAGRGNVHSTNDGIGKFAGFAAPRGVAVDSHGQVFVTDYANHTIRKGMLFAITAAPSDQTVPAGADVQLSVAVDGAGPFTFQWTQDGVPLANETNTTLSLPAVGRAQGGLYAVEVRNPAGDLIRLESQVRVMITPSLLTPIALENGGVRVLLQDTDGGVPPDLSIVGLQRRGDLNEPWVSVPAIPYYTNNMVAFDDLEAGSGPAGFYRVREP